MNEQKKEPGKKSPSIEIIDIDDSSSSSYSSSDGEEISNSGGSGAKVDGASGNHSDSDTSSEGEDSSDEEGKKKSSKRTTSTGEKRKDVRADENAKDGKDVKKTAEIAGGESDSSPDDDDGEEEQQDRNSQKREEKRKTKESSSVGDVKKSDRSERVDEEKAQNKKDAKKKEGAAQIKLQFKQENEEKKSSSSKESAKRQKAGENTEESKKDGNNRNLKKEAVAAEPKRESSSSVLTESSFAELGVCEPLVEACQASGWKTATRIQKEVLPYAFQGRDIIGLAETGSGKTGAFCLPLLQELLNNPIRGAVFGLILTPTRELAFQIHQVLQALSGTIGATSLCIVGGVDKTSQSIALARVPHVVIATPGRLIDHLEHTKGFHLSKLRFLVLDEADRMLSMDFEEELNQILDVIHEDRRTMLFSATMTSKVQKLQRASLTDPVKLEISAKFQTPSQLLQSYLFIPAKYKDCYLTWLIHEHAGQSVLVFGMTCNNVQRLALMLRNLGFPAICLHGQMSQPKRLGALNKFQSGDRTVLICTDVASRGLDIPSVDVVINYDLPGHGKDYIHRVGRTARAGRSGKAIAMVTQYDVEVYQRLEALLGKKLPEYKLDEATVLVLLERVNEAQRLATRELKEQLASGKSNGRRKHRRSNDDDDDGDGGEEDGIQSVIQKGLRKGYYAGGSGGRGGAMPNQRGYAGKKKKQRR